MHGIANAIRVFKYPKSRYILGVFFKEFYQEIANYAVAHFFVCLFTFSS